MKKPNILITGAGGQIGSVLRDALRKRYGHQHVLATDIHPPAVSDPHFETLDILDTERLDELIFQHQIDQVYHLAAILSAKGEQNPRRTWQVNMDGLFNVLEAGRKHRLQRIFYPSSIAVFGPSAQKDQTPQSGVLDPTTVYGISKVAGEHWCRYYAEKYGLDIRSLRYPGVIGHQSMAGGGTTDYAVDIFHAAVKGEVFDCFLKANTYLPMIYMPDAIRATIDLMEAPGDQIRVRDAYNINGMSFCPAEIADEIRKHFPSFTIRYRPDHRQAIADSWNHSVDDGAARRDFGWEPEFDLPAMTRDMICHLQKKYAKQDPECETLSN